jgi:RNA polymerase sigma-70 factor (ECF subfamily)
MDRDEVRFRALYEENIRSVLGFVIRRTESPDDAADVVADTFLTAWRKIEDAPSGAEGRLWLFGVARMKLLNQRRGQKRRGHLAERLRTELAGPDVTQWSPVPDGRVSALTKGLSSLRPEDRELLTLSVWEDLTASEMARVLGCSENAAKLRLSRARKRLAGILEEREPARTDPHPHRANGRRAATTQEVPREGP